MLRLNPADLAASSTARSTSWARIREPSPMRIGSMLAVCSPRSMTGPGSGLLSGSDMLKPCNYRAVKPMSKAMKPG